MIVLRRKVAPTADATYQSDHVRGARTRRGKAGRAAKAFTHTVTTRTDHARLQEKNSTCKMGATSWWQARRDATPAANSAPVVLYVGWLIQKAIHGFLVPGDKDVSCGHAVWCVGVDVKPCNATNWTPGLPQKRAHTGSTTACVRAMRGPTHDDTLASAGRRYIFSGDPVEAGSIIHLLLYCTASSAPSSCLPLWSLDPSNSSDCWWLLQPDRDRSRSLACRPWIVPSRSALPDPKYVTSACRRWRSCAWRGEPPRRRRRRRGRRACLCGGRWSGSCSGGGRRGASTASPPRAPPPRLRRRPSPAWLTVAESS